MAPGEEVTLGEVYRLVLSAIQTLDHIGGRLDNLDQRYMRADLHELQRKLDRQEVADIKTELTRQGTSRWRLISAVLIPVLVSIIGAGTTVLIYAAESH